MAAIAYSKDALKVLKRMPANAAALVRSKIADYAANPSGLANNVKALRGDGADLRLRVGDWRVLMAIESDRLIVVKIGPRGSIYD
ncbi:MAG: type II toxin-antitoxin system RelE/ParE family toxin [Alphaproteobacteria bacterium]|nr:type II toxin-antitoxin system RelE/ParE family toxin [Alphaproteobacteria bacterium]